jgi:type I restriction enzyme S subunit
VEEMMFYKETDFQDTEIGKIPHDWKKVKLKEILEEVDVRVGDTEDLKRAEVLSLTKNYGLIPQADRFEKRVATEDLSDYKIIRQGWLVYNPYVIWEGAIYFLKNVDLGLVSPVYVVWKTNSEVDYLFLDYLVRTKEMLNSFFRLSTGAVQRRRAIKKKSFLEIPIPLPPLREQRAIAEVLGVVDSVIAKTGEVIAKTERLKKGLMQTLLTRGIGHKEYKQTPIGTIPKEWEVVKVEDVAETSSGGTPNRSKKEYYGGNIPWVKSGELKDNTIYDTEEKITENGLKNSSAKLLPRGTLLVAMYGATVGKTGILGIDATTNQAVCAILPKNNSLNLSFLQYYIIFARNRWISQSSGGAQPNISQEIIRTSRIPLPKFEEQQKISEILSTLDTKLALEKKEKARLERIKRGLMELLLTGKIRVKVSQD